MLSPPTNTFNDYSSSVRWTARTEANRRAALDRVLVTIQLVSDLEASLLITVPWTESTPEYIATVQYIRQRDYHRILDKLEQLVIQRLFELSKANVVGMGKSHFRQLVKKLTPTCNRLQTSRNSLESTKDTRQSNLYRA